jgi:2,3,4,5-tetrahydropyridine-2-carboxylate N-succinyltransferase
MWLLTQSTKIIDVTGKDPIEMKGIVPERSVVIPGSYTKAISCGRISGALRIDYWKKKRKYRFKNIVKRCLKREQCSRIILAQFL